MKDIYLINYSVKGIKALDEWVHLSFYKKTITNNFDIRNYNIKGIYGTNGAGKSAIMTSLKILKSLLIDDAYLSNPLVQKQLEEIVNKREGKIEYDIQFLVNYEDGLRLYNYLISVGKKNSTKWSIIEEKLFFRKAVSHNSHMDLLFHAAELLSALIAGNTQTDTQAERTLRQSAFAQNRRRLCFGDIGKSEEEGKVMVGILHDSPALPLVIEQRLHLHCTLLSEIADLPVIQESRNGTRINRIHGLCLQQDLLPLLQSGQKCLRHLDTLLPVGLVWRQSKLNTCNRQFHRLKMIVPKKKKKIIVNVTCIGYI